MNVLEIVRSILIDAFNVINYPLIQGMVVNDITLNIRISDIIVTSTCITGVLYVLRKIK